MNDQIVLKAPWELQLLRRSNHLVAETLQALAGRVKPGVTTLELDRFAESYLLAQGAKPAFKGYRDYPFTLCTSINEQVVHGLPSTRRLEEGDILSLDMASFPQLFYLDCHGNSGMASLALAGTYVTYLNANSCALGQASVDAVLVALDGNGLLNGTVNLGGAGNSAPSATGLAAASSLQTSKGWSVTHN